MPWSGYRDTFESITLSVHCHVVARVFVHIAGCRNANECVWHGLKHKLDLIYLCKWSTSIYRFDLGTHRKSHTVSIGHTQPAFSRCAWLRVLNNRNGLALGLQRRLWTSTVYHLPDSLLKTSRRTISTFVTLKVIWSSSERYAMETQSLWRRTGYVLWHEPLSVWPIGTDNSTTSTFCHHKLKNVTLHTKA